MKFEQALKLVGIAEGGYSNDPTDKGGETVCGISRNKHPDSAIWNYIDRWKQRGNTSAASLTKLAKNDPQVQNIVAATYRGLYWTPAHCNELPGLLCYPIFSCAVNCGVITAIKILQRALNIKDDGLFGRQTRTTALNTPTETTLAAFYIKWSEYYDRIVQNNPTQQKYINGWKNRIEQVKKDNC